MISGNVEPLGSRALDKSPEFLGSFTGLMGALRIAFAVFSQCVAPPNYMRRWTRVLEHPCLEYGDHDLEVPAELLDAAEVGFFGPPTQGVRVCQGWLGNARSVPLTTIFSQTQNATGRGQPSE